MTRGALMVCGTGSDVGKSHLVAGICRVLARRGVNVAPFKAQNMALNSFVTAEGHEIGRAQAAQARAARVAPEVAMNPVLLKPEAERTSQLVVMGRPAGRVDAASYQARKAELMPLVLESLGALRQRHDVVVCEGAGSPAEINLGQDIVNLTLAERARLPVLLVGDIDRGGVFAALYGTVALLDPRRRALVRAFVINKLRGDPALLGPGPADLERRCGVPTIGVVPYLHDVSLDAEDSLSLPAPSTGRAPETPGRADTLDVAAVRFPRLSNFTDLDALRVEPGVSVRLVGASEEVGDPDLVVLPGTKSTVADLEWLRLRGLDAALGSALGGPRPPVVLGICGGYQMLGSQITDDVESRLGTIRGLGWLGARTTFAERKITRQRRGWALGHRVQGYEIRHGVTRRCDGAPAWVKLQDAYGDEDEGAVGAGGGVLGTSLHGILEADTFRASLLGAVAQRRGVRFDASGASFAAAREAQLDRLADAVEDNVDLAALERIIEGSSLTRGTGR